MRIFEKGDLLCGVKRQGSIDYRRQQRHRSATVKRFLEEGSRVFFCGFDQASVDSTLMELGPLGKVNGIVCDVSSVEDVARLVDAAEKTLQGIDILINNAGVAGDVPFWK
jgi:NAD(P)-dependent dehydrogenase (short-subunit alcohol dehydrogenase family)